MLTMMKGKQHYYNVLMNNTKSLNPYSCLSTIERAFAQDAGGCIWPPRSYTCGFCRREFTSAQALGGHMNVHRRDRAMLSQSLNPNPLNPNLFSSAQSRVSSSGAKVEDFTRSYEMGTDLSVGLSCKRPRLAVSSSPSPSSLFRASSIEDLDLELRLGHDPPQVK